VELSLAPGEVGWAEGRNGSGKSLLLYLCAGLLTPASGRVTIAGEPPLPDRVTMLFQNPDYQLLSPRVDMDVALNATSDETASRALAATGLTHLGDRGPADLTPGQRRRAALAGVLAAARDVVLLDTPFAGMGREEARELWGEMRPFLTGQGSAVLITGEPVEETNGYRRWELAQWHR
jgi:energy-coupling factor transporter ATP-binding protein EcfA2